MTSALSSAESIFQDLCLQRQSDVDNALIAAAHSDFTSPIIFRRVLYKTCGGLFSVGTWVRVQVIQDPNNQNVYVLPPIPSAWMASEAAVPNIIKLERVMENAQTDDLHKIAPLKAWEDENCSPVKILVTASTLVDGIDSEKEPAKAYKHDNMLLSIERSFFNDEKTEDSCTGAVKTVLLNWLTNRKTDGYFRI